MPSEQEFTELQEAVIALDKRMAQAEAALVLTRQILDMLVELTDSLHRRLSRFRDAPRPSSGPGSRRDGPGEPSPAA